MSSKSKLIIGIVMLAVGAGLVPTGLLTNEYLRDQVYDGVPEALLGIKDDAISGLMDEFPVLATPDVLSGAKAQAAAGLEPMIAVKSTPAALLGLKAQIEGKLPDIINFGTAAQLIDISIGWLNATYGWDIGTNIFFNDTTFVDPFTTLLGVSNMTGIPQNYTLTARTTLLLTGVADIYVTPYVFPGMITDLDMGSGVEAVYNLFWYIVGGGDVYTNVALPAAYNITLAQVADMANYLWTVITYYVPPTFLATYGVSTTEAAATGFYRQWANGTFFDDGIDIGAFLGTSELKGFEVGVPDPTNISISTSMALWNASNPLAFTNDDGILAWLGAGAGNTTLFSLLISTFGLTPTQLTMILSWLNNFITNLTPALVLADTGKTINELSTLALYEQWANGTIFGEVLLPDGFLGEIAPSMGGAPYFEVGLPTATGLSLAECLSLWSELHDKTFIYSPSFQDIWLPSLQGNTTTQAEIIAAFGISPTELTALLTWLGAFLGSPPSTGRSAELLALDAGQTLTAIATEAFYEQWTRGTINGEDFLPEGFLSRRDPPIYGPPYFELGLMYPIAPNSNQTQALWDENSEYSLVTVSGINKWYRAKEGNAVYATLQAQNEGLLDLEMGAILTWLPQFRDEIGNILGKTKYSLPLEPYNLGETLVLGLGAGGGVIAALGIVVLILSRRS